MTPSLRQLYLSLGLGLLMAIDQAVAAGSASAYHTTADGKNNLSSTSAPTQGGNGSWTLHVDDTSSGHKQAIGGFGAAVTDVTVKLINSLSDSSKDELLGLILSKGSKHGADFSLFRHTIAVSDLSLGYYTYDDNNGSADPLLNAFNLGDNGTAMASLLAEFRQRKSNITIFGSPWTPPEWMKANHNLTGETDNRLSDEYYEAYAQYLAKYLQAYDNQNASIDAISIQNEPLHAEVGTPTMRVLADQAVDLIQNHLRSALSDAKLGTKIWALDHNTGPFFPFCCRPSDTLG